LKNFYNKSQVCNELIMATFFFKNVNISTQKNTHKSALKIDNGFFVAQSFYCIYEKPAIFTRFLHSINTERLHRRAGKPRLSRHSEWEILQNGSEALFYISFLSLPPRSVPFSSLPNLPSLSREKRSRFRTIRKRWRCTCERIDVSSSLMTTTAAAVAASSASSASSSSSSSSSSSLSSSSSSSTTTSTQREKRPSVARPRNYRSGNPRFRSTSVLLRRCCFHRRRRRYHRRRRRRCRRHRRHHHYRPLVTAAGAAVAAMIERLC